MLVLAIFFFACLLAPEAELYRKTSHSYDAESSPSGVQLFFSPLSEIFCAQLLNNTWKHMKWKKIAARFHLIWPSKKQTKQKLASVVIIIYYKWNDICKKIMSFFSDKIPCLCSPKASPPPPCPLNTTIFLFIYIISSLCLKQRKKMEQISEKKTSPSNREKK